MRRASSKGIGSSGSIARSRASSPCLVLVMVSDPPPYDESFNEHMIALGRVAAMWADFEFLINESIWELANVERQVGACITAQLIGPAPRFRTLIALAHLRDANDAL